MKARKYKALFIWFSSSS